MIYGMDESKDLIPRIGTFFLVIGVGLTLLFLFSDMAGQIEFQYFFAGITSLVIGTFFRRRQKAPPPANRFSAIKKMRAKSKEKKKK